VVKRCAWTYSVLSARGDPSSCAMAMPPQHSFRREAYTCLNYWRTVMAHLNVYVFHCSRCGEPAISLFKERTPGGIESQDTIFAAIDLKSIRTQCSACKHTQFRDASDAAHHQSLDWN
jgi:hypothetical protein